MKISLRVRYILFIGILHIVLILMIFFLLREKKIYFIASEVLILVSIVISIQIYRDFLRPIEFVRSGIEAIKDKDFSIKFVQTGKSEIDILIEVYNLMIDQLREERIKLNEQHFFLEKLIEASPIAILIMDFDEKMVSVNGKGKRLFQKSQTFWMGKKLEELDFTLFPQLADLQDGESRTVKINSVETYKVQRSHFMDQGFRRSFLMIEELTTDILESEKKAYGKVIRMMAHEVNNTLGATDSILQTTRNYLAEDSFLDLREALGVASDRNKRLAIFMRNFADVVRLPIPFKEKTDVVGLLRSVGTFMRPMAERKGISLEVDFSEIGEIWIDLDAGQMEQVFVNVVKNAIEACETGNLIQLKATRGNILIRNNGKQIAEETAVQLFNPFFSTKKDGQGIGLTLTKEILVSHGFSFSLTSGSDGWTLFEISKPE
ncbi:sensor histidine kinase [Dyadobacter frigoris]|uniref:histidine kinase n=1 Tax=Dyadobacter frigoris TaxID=2576211 RepID=A0A4U6D3U3_9BACT|nr:ATP-binding protein [Dyadobacter frigoris]TKT88594.1 histidine kinase [Dyadobacter frigoris]GLU54646.1 sensor histidine kinase [Dyadobacter frigoris]